MSTVTDEIKSRVDLVELISRSVALKRVGAYYRGLCPFHSEKTPSFYVRPQTQSWHCFGCGKWGTAFDWLMEREHIDFGEALRTLAAMAGVQLPERGSTEAEDDQARRLYTILERAQTFYVGVFWGGAGQRAREYMSRRGLNDETLRAFGIGYAPSGNGLLRYLEKDGFGEQELQAAGVIGVTEDEGRPYDFFRERVIFPIRDTQGRPIAFGGRAIEDGVTPKYLNSRDTLLFHKQETLFALDLARRPIARERQVVIVEGYMDAAMAHQHGYHNVVATLGTAVTDKHLRLLRRQVDEIVLALDADTAGQAATWRALQQADESLREGVKPVVMPGNRRQQVARGHWVRLKVLALPNSKDPDELIRTDPNAWPMLVRDAVSVIDFVLRRLGDRHDLGTPQGKRAAADDMIEVLSSIPHGIEQDHFINVVSEMLGTKPTAIRELLRRSSQIVPARSQQQVATADVRGDPRDDYLLALVIRARETGHSIPEPEFIVPESKWLYDSLGGPIPLELQPWAQRAERKLADAQRLSGNKLLEEVERTQLEIKQQQLVRRQEEIARRIREIDPLEDGAELHALQDQLRDLAHSIDQINQQAQRESAGTR